MKMPTHALELTPSLGTRKQMYQTSAECVSSSLTMTHPIENTQNTVPLEVHRCFLGSSEALS
eukprot:4261733-Heterocapsa_arctica.AAC.1